MWPIATLNRPHRGSPPFKGAPHQPSHSRRPALPSARNVDAGLRFGDPPPMALETLVVSVISILEVFMWVLREYSESQSIQAVAAMQRRLVVDLDSALVIAAAQVSHAPRLPMTGSIVLPHGSTHQALLLKMDADFGPLGGDVELIQKLAGAVRHQRCDGNGTRFLTTWLVSRPGDLRTKSLELLQD